jgi:hypothetical protein
VLGRRSGAVSPRPSSMLLVALRVEDAQRRKCREKKKRKGGGGNPSIHRHTQNQLWGWAVSVSHEATWSIWRRFLKTFRRKGEFSAEKLNLPYSSGPIWDLSLLTAPQGTAMIFCTACTPRIPSLIKGCLCAGAQLTARQQNRPADSTPARPLPTHSATAPLVFPAH